MRNDLRAQGLEVPDAVARPAASPDLAMQALREVENQPHAGRQHNNKAEEVEISEDDEVVERGSGRRFEDDLMEVSSLFFIISKQHVPAGPSDHLIKAYT